MDEAWERAVEAARGGDDYEAVRSLTLDGAVKCSQGRLPASALLQQFSQLRVLSIANVGLASLTDFPSLPYLERLVLSDNRISGGLEALVEAGLVSLRDLDLSNNKLQTLEDLVPLAKLNLLSLDLYECPVTRIPDYRAKVFSSIKSLQYLDKVDAEDNERPESEEEEDDDDDDEDDEDGLDVDDYEAAGLPKPGATGIRFHNVVDDEDGAEDDEESDEIDEEEEEGLQYNGLMNRLGGEQEDSGSEDDEDDEDEDDVGDGDAVEVHDIEETEEDEDEGGDEDAEGEEDDEEDDDDEDDDEGGTELALSLEGEIDAQEEVGDDENGELGDEDVVIEQDGEEDDEDVEYYGSSYAGRVEDEEDSDVEPGDDDDDEDDEENGQSSPPVPSSKRKRSKDEDSDSDDERPPKH